MKNNSVYKDAFKVSGCIFLFGAIELLIFTMTLSFRIDILWGVLYGCAFVSLSFFYLASCVKKSVEKDKKAAKIYMATSYNIRLISTAVMVIFAVRSENIYLWAAIIPLFFQRIAVYVVEFLNSRRKKGSENS